MRILHVVPTYIPAYRYGGPIYAVHGLCKALAARGHDVHVFTTNVDGPNDSPVLLCRPIDMDNVKVWYFPCSHLRRLYWSPPMKTALRGHICGFDILHLHSIFLWPTSAAASVAREHGVPYVLAPHGMLVKDLISKKSRLPKTLWISMVERRNIQGAAAIHVTTAWEQRECVRFAMKFPRFLIAPFGVEPVDLGKPLGALRPDIEMILNRQPLILFLGRISWKKGLDRLIPALALVPSAQLVIAGNDEENYSVFLRKLIERCGVQDRVTFTGAVHSDDKVALLRAANIFVLPSYSENFGIAVLEAMAHGCPVVVTPEVGLSAAVSKSSAGLVIDGSPEALAKAIVEIIANKKLLSEMGQRGQRLVKEQFSWPVVAGQMERIYSAQEPS